MKYSAVIFDLDGTLVDSETVSLQAGIAAFARFGWAADEAFMLTLVGSDWPSCMKVLRAKFGEADFEQVADVWREESLKRADMITRKDGALEILLQLRSQSVPVAVATSSGTAGAKKKLELTGLAPHIDALVTRDDVTHPKPNPEPFITAAQKLAVSPKDCLAFEDSHTGVASAKAAGMFVVQVPDLLPAGDQADLVADSLLQGLTLANG